MSENTLPEPNNASRRRFVPRPKQADVLAYQGGKMGVSAVPGSGKTATLSYLAAKLVAQTDLEPNQEILVVTLVKSAVGNFATSMAGYLRDEFNLLPGLGYRVRTLHGLANDIVHERPGLVGLSDTFTVLDERAADDILQEAVETWARANPDSPDQYLTPEHFGNQYTRTNHWPDLIKNMASNFIRQAKDLQIPVQEIADLIEAYGDPLPLAAICTEIYDQYERSLRYRGAVDFQDLIRLALRILRLDADYLARLQHRFPYILEDEAQDSSKLQEDILRLLAGDGGNWVRVGDPNQAIYETFTTANPKFLRDFLEEIDVVPRTLPNSGRSTISIINLANYLIDWSIKHPNKAIRAREPLSKPHIEPTPPGDPQGNPPNDPRAVVLVGSKFSGDDERQTIINNLKEWLPDNPDKTCAVLMPINSSGAKMVQSLRKEGIKYVENLRSTSGTRAIVGALNFVLTYLEDPKDSSRLGQVYRVWRRDDRGDADEERSIENVVKALRGIHSVEDFLYPRATDWLEANAGDNEALMARLVAFRALVRRWQAASDLPIDQLILTISADLFKLETDIATAYAVALYLRRFAELHPEARLPEYRQELEDIAKGKRNFSGISDADDAFDPDEHKGEVTVTTMHKAKGLEWDRVYIMAANNYNYPSADPFDSFMGERWFIRNELNLEAEALGQLNALYTHTPYQEGQPTQDARIEYAAERLRLLYVGITRARRELVITWNTGRNGEQVEARPVAALRGWWVQQRERA
ncbi:ATP-dependent helicase [Phototrophicus methaneseepsis]|uniref:DNA 3'-5' helicase n=1 Tax=Phototrophicus methaneseepsis TaxID=2710758 RepID=A0A7S8EBQ0_9CHLR|nr:ATP-dependent helicase [Phototrophicus methaneseepsis]QPC84006.1 ATP-dependent helicase [Phototrophicus methaneseepsis]